MRGYDRRRRRRRRAAEEISAGRDNHADDVHELIMPMPFTGTSEQGVSTTDSKDA